jgi:acyl-CoA thioester hydrolase
LSAPAAFTQLTRGNVKHSDFERTLSNCYLSVMQNFKHKFPIQIRFKDIDKMGHVNNANYLTYIETARVKYFEDVVGTDRKWSHQVGIILARIEIDYKAPVFLHDTVFVYTRCSRIGTKSITLDWAIVREKSGGEEVVAKGIAVLVCYDYTHNATIAVPDEQRRSLEAFEGLVP